MPSREKFYSIAVQVLQRFPWPRAKFDDSAISSDVLLLRKQPSRPRLRPNHCGPARPQGSFTAKVTNL
jgi:hypothetical protein